MGKIIQHSHRSIMTLDQLRCMGMALGTPAKEQDSISSHSNPFQNFTSDTVYTDIFHIYGPNYPSNTAILFCS
jgi:hypothetical protein